MPVVSRPANHVFTLKIKDGKDVVEFQIKQLLYAQKAHIMNLSTSTVNGETTIDQSLTCFYNLKYALKEVKGIVDENGKPLKLSFDEDGSVADECVDELLGTSVSDGLQYAALKLSDNRFPDEVTHPVTGLPIKGVEVIHPSKLKLPKKKSGKASK